MKKMFVSLVIALSMVAGLFSYTGSAEADSRTNIPYTAISPKPKCSIKSNSCIPPKAFTSLLSVRDYIRAAKKGSTINISMYSQNRQWIMNELIRAHKRGVNIHYVGWTTGNSKELKTLTKVVGTNLKKRSWVKLCRGACRLGGKGGIHHAKLITFSQVNKTKYITFVLSGNLTKSAAMNQWNTLTRVFNNYCLYAASNRYISALTKDRWTGVTKQAHCGAYTMYFYPQPKKPQDPILSDVRAVDCKYGKKNRSRSRITVVMAFWSGNRNSFTRELGKKRRQGCVVEVMYSGGVTSKAVTKQLKKDHVASWNSWKNKGQTYIHAKSVYLAGRIHNKVQNISYTGNQNMTKAGQRSNDDVLLRSTVYAEYRSNMAVVPNIKAHSYRQKW